MTMNNNVKIISISNHSGDSYRAFRKEIVLEVEGQQARVTLSSRPYKRSYRERNRKSRLSVYGTATENIWENFTNRTRRPYVEYRKIAKPFLEALGYPTKGLVWSQYAFCSCPCSPAFIMDAKIKSGIPTKGYTIGSFMTSEIVDIDIYVNLEVPMTDEAIPVDPARVEAIERVLVGIL